MKKIALMTWHHVRNYGTLYQGYALYQTIKSLGYDVDVINYSRMESKLINKKDLFSYLISVVKSLKKTYEFDGKVFDNFSNKYFTYTDKCIFRQDFESLNNLYGCFICGSDQIWNPRWYDPHYFLDFVYDSRKKFSYAPSVGVSSFMDYDASSDIKVNLEKFEYISVRERQGVNAVNEILNENKAKTVLDPVFLLKKKEWINLSSKINIKEKDYALVFFLKNNSENLKKCIKYSKDINLHPIVYHCMQSEDNKYSNINIVSPEELLSLIEGAKYIFTDSYHIMALSLIFEKQFSVFSKFKKYENISENSRIIDLLEKLNIHLNLNELNNNVIDYSLVNVRLEELRSDSFSFLKDSLNEIVSSKVSMTTIQICESENFDNTCNCEYPIEFKNYLKENYKYLSFINKHIIPFGFCFEEKCYGCKKNIKLVGGNYIRKPTFYANLKNDYLNNRNIYLIYLEYFFVYDLIHNIKKLIKRFR